MDPGPRGHAITPPLPVPLWVTGLTDGAADAPENSAKQAPNCLVSPLTSTDGARSKSDTAVTKTDVYFYMKAHKI